MLALLFGASMAATLSVEAGGVGEAGVVVALAVVDGATEARGCRDDGGAPDAAVDGIWTCAPFKVSGATTSAAIVVDGRLYELGEIATPGAETTVQARIQAGRIQSATRGDLLVPQPGAAAHRPTPLVLLRLVGTFDQGAPVARLVGERGTTQLSCSDDGQFPDALRNDGIRGCAGPATGADLTVWVQGAGSEPLRVGTATVDQDLTVAAFEVDVASGRIAPATGPLPWPAASQVVEEPIEPKLLEGAEEAAPTPPQPQAAERPAPPSASQERPSPNPASAPGASLFDALAALGGIGIGALAAWLLFRRRGRLPPGLQQLPAPPLLPGGPPLSEPVALIRTARADLLLPELLARLARERRVVVVRPPSGPLAPVPGHPVYLAQHLDWEEVEQAVRALLRQPGAPLAVLVQGRATLTEPGAVGGDPAALLLAALPQGVWTGILLEPEAPGLGFHRPWRATQEPEWRLQPE